MLRRTEWSARIKAIEEAARAPGMRGPEIVRIFNDPERERAGPDMATIAGVLYQRGEDEQEGAFHARLTAAARIAGEAYVYVSMAQDYGLADYREPGDDDPTKTIEIGDAAQPRAPGGC
jgi:hypothetical protein